MVEWGVPLLDAALLVALLAAFFAGFASGLTGFAFALISVPLFLLVYDPSTVVALIGVLAVFINIVVVRDSYREADWRAVLALLPAALLGLFVGVEILAAVDPDYIRLGVGIVVVASVVFLVRETSLPGAEGRLGPVVAGFSSGALSTSAGLAGPPIALLFASRKLPKNRFRGSSAAYFLIIGVAGLPVLVHSGIVNGENALLAITLVPASLLGKIVGTSLLARLSEETFRRVTLTIVVLTGVLGVATAVRALFW
ncbi:MAG: Cobalt-zinc-cadmium resistance protein CzcA; Cation efflux system protein CusA [uncultured Rubrobacteraceae bacterium]|uniref:Probable membrane transporter protein n=1 Tax=uncultured Rubrobacteraceae bacterium TaxID=349277 RepID=A0A6J4R4D6_9ACTN|nr:MAG: Cobalt-zinc-cadmium resistance protein CzcA; Cation efflux system protein CusA [uncultured Rubrobacteraceae bacterium]